MTHPASSQLRYTETAIILHWAIAACIVTNLLTGLLFGWMSGDRLHFWVRAHASVGMTLLALTSLRIVWRLTHRPPPMLPMHRWERRLAHPVHFLLYLSMIAIPLSGWVVESSFRETPPAKSGLSGPAPAASPTFAVWGSIPVPKLGLIKRQGDGPDGARRLDRIHDQSLSIHLINAWAMFGLLLLHIGGALKHQFIDRERELARMGIGRAGPRSKVARS